MLVFDKEDIIWAAGFYCGEGCIGTYITGTNRTNKSIILSVAQSGDPEALYRFQDAFPQGLLTGPYNQSKTRKPVWKYRATGYQPCQYIIGAMWPWLTPDKKEQSTKALLAMRSYRSQVTKGVPV